tara:strand:+ start:1795 stop:2385 length:591 start_codon:yes stop_codon:yes gene_type:complete
MSLSQELKRIKENVKPTKTVDFVLPLLGYSKADLSPYLVNAYLGDTSMTDWDFESPDVFVLLRWIYNHSFKEMEKMLENDKYFKVSYDPIDGYIMFVFTISPSFKPDFIRFMNGKYSELSDPAKIRIMRHRTKQSPMPLILDKDSSLKEHWENKIGVQLSSNDEVWPIVNRNDEIFDKNEFKKLMNIVDIAGIEYR